MYGAQGEAWFARLPSLIKELEKTFSLSQLRPFTNLSYHYVLSGYQGHDPIVLKLGIDEKSLTQEAAALKAFEGYGCIKLLAEGKSFLLLERAIPGGSLKSYFPDREEQAISVTADLMRSLHKAPVPDAGQLPHLRDWLQKLDADWDVPLPYLEEARRLRCQLLKTAASEVLLHGDLHHENILQGSRKWVAIDPKGVMGDPAYDTVSFIINPMQELIVHPQAKEIIHYRIYSLSSLLKINPGHLQDWCFVKSVLGWIWALEDGIDSEIFFQMTNMFDSLRNTIK